MSLRVARLAGGGCVETWMRLQSMYDLKKATHDSAPMSRVRKVPAMRAQDVHV